MPSSRLDNNERPGSKELSPVSSWILLGSHLLPILMCCTAYPVEESAHCSFGQLSKLPVAVPKSAVQ